MIHQSIINAFREKKLRQWDVLYFAVDLHGTIIQKYKGNDIQPYNDAIKVLTELSQMSNIVLILFTSTYKQSLEPFFNWCEEHQIKFKFFNENPECPSNSTGDFSRKFYYNVLIDDRAGFDPSEWLDVLHAVTLGQKMFECVKINCNYHLINNCNDSICVYCKNISLLTTCSKNA